MQNRSDQYGKEDSMKNKVAEITIETDDPSVVKKILTFIWDNDLRAMPKVKHFRYTKRR